MKCSRITMKNKEVVGSKNLGRSIITTATARCRKDCSRLVDIGTIWMRKPERCGQADGSS